MYEVETETDADADVDVDVDAEVVARVWAKADWPRHFRLGLHILCVSKKKPLHWSLSLALSGPLRANPHQHCSTNCDVEAGIQSPRSASSTAQGTLLTTEGSAKASHPPLQ